MKFRFPVAFFASMIAFSAVAVDLPKKIKKEMPGIGTYTLQENNTISPTVLTVGSQGTYVVAISNKFPNRIATPFNAPRAIDSSKVDIVQDGSSLFVSPKTNEPFVIYITGTDPGDQVISLTLVPRELPAQTIILQIDTPAAAREQKNESYVQQLVNLMRQVAVGKTPDGFAEGLIPKSVAVAGEVQILPEKRYSGTWIDIYQYVVLNNSKKAIELSETSFYKKGVRAVSIYPTLTVGPGEKTQIFVIADKTVLDGDANGTK